MQSDLFSPDDAGDGADAQPADEAPSDDDALAGGDASDSASDVEDEDEVTSRTSDPPRLWIVVVHVRLHPVLGDGQTSLSPLCALQSVCDATCWQWRDTSEGIEQFQISGP